MLHAPALAGCPPNGIAVQNKLAGCTSEQPTVAFAQESVFPSMTVNVDKYSHKHNTWNSFPRPQACLGHHSSKSCLAAKEKCQTGIWQYKTWLGREPLESSSRQTLSIVGQACLMRWLIPQVIWIYARKWVMALPQAAPKNWFNLGAQTTSSSHPEDPIFIYFGVTVAPFHEATKGGEGPTNHLAFEPAWRPRSSDDPASGWFVPMIPFIRDTMVSVDRTNMHLAPAAPAAWLVFGSICIAGCMYRCPNIQAVCMAELFAMIC